MMDISKPNGNNDNFICLFYGLMVNVIVSVRVRVYTHVREFPEKGRGETNVVQSKVI